MQNIPKPQILCVDSDELQLSVLDLVLRRDGYKPLSANNHDTALRLAQEQQPALILLDLDLDAAVAELAAIAPVILMSGSEINDRAMRGFDAGAAGFIHKPALNLRKLKDIIAGYLPQPA